MKIFESFNVLHITDFHLKDFYGFDENLRNGFYREFINELDDQICTSLPDNKKVDALIITGDIVEKHSVNNYEHANTIVNYILAKLNLTNNDVCICVGNHDINRSEEKLKNIAGARSDFRKFADSFSAGSEIHNDERYTLWQYADNVYFMSVDSTLGDDGHGRPGTLSQSEEDGICNTIIDRVSNESLLLIATHFPPYINNRSASYTEETDWIDKHYWRAANKLVDRIIRIRKVGQTAWFYGDAHFNDFASEAFNHHFILTGMFGGSYKDRKRRNEYTNEMESLDVRVQARMLSFKEIADSPEILTYNYQNETFTPAPSRGRWITSSSSIRLQRIADNKKGVEGEIIALENKPSVQTKTVQNHKAIEVIGESLQSAIIERVKSERLYSVGRYITSESSVALGWIPLNKLMEEYSILSSCIEKSIEWLSLLGLEINELNTIIVGADFWGSVIASQLSVRLNIRNLCLSTRINNADSVYQDNISRLVPDLCSGKNIENVIILTDVISSGCTLNKVHDLLFKELECISIKVNKWVALSILADHKPDNQHFLDRFFKVGTMCNEIKIPVLKKEDLPSEEILPPKIDLR